MIKNQKELFTFDKREPIRGYPELRWAGKRPFTGTSYYPAQLKETYGTDTDGWMNKIYWGDNLQVMSHLLKEFRGKVDLIYIDPPFDSKADYKKRITLKQKSAASDSTSFEEKQYGDIWTNDEYLQFMYERLILCKELLSDSGNIFVECDTARGHYLKVIFDEIFGSSNFVNQVIWKRTFSHGDVGQGAKHFGRLHDMILFYKKTSNNTMNTVYVPYTDKYINDFYRYKDENGKPYRLVSLLGPGGAAKGNPYYEFMGVTRYWVHSKEKMNQLLAEGRIIQTKPGAVPQKKRYLDESPGVPLQDIWTDLSAVQGGATENYDYPTQKPEALLERIIKASSNPGDLVFDCFMGSGTTQAVAMKLGRRFLGADINMGAIQTTTKRLINRAKELNSQITDQTYYTGFEVYNVNDYEFFRNELEAKRLIIEALGMQPLPDNNLWDAELDGRMVAILGINRIATASEFEKIVANMDLAALSRKQGLNPTKPVEKVTFVCMGHDPNLKPMFLEKMESLGLNIDLEIVDLLRDKKDLRFKRESDARVQIVSIRNKRFLEIQSFYPMNLLQKLSIEHQDIEDWRELVDSVLIDWNYDEVTFSPTTLDIPDKKDLVSDKYEVPEGAGRIHVKITDLLSESWEGTIEAD